MANHPESSVAPLEQRAAALELVLRRKGDLPETFVDYDQTPREYFLNAVTTVLDVQTRVSDLYNQPYDQIQE